MSRRSRARLSFRAAIVLAAAFLLLGPRPAPAQTTSSTVVPGGFLETATSGWVRPRLTASQIQAMLPSRGPFTFPSPYLTQAARITNGTDCGGGDCVEPIGYSYWRNINNHVGSDTMLIFLGMNAGRGGEGPTLFEYDKVTDAVTKAGPLFDAGSRFRGATGEGWYFSATMPNALYMNDGTKVLRYDVLARQFTTVYDAASRFGSDKYIWQMHSSDDDRVHSATLRQLSTSKMLGCLVYKEDTSQFLWYPEIGLFDECNLDKSGRWLLILDNIDGKYGLDNRIIDLTTGTETDILDQNGGLGHVDMGYGYMVGEDDWASEPGAARVWKFGQPYTPSANQGEIVYYTSDWSIDLGHLTHGNAKPGIAAEQQYSCSSKASRTDLPRANEIICYRNDTSMDVLVVAPVMTDLNASGGGDDYSKQPKGNMDDTGRYFVWTANMGGSRLDAFVVKVPGDRLVGGSTDVTPPVVSISSPAAGASVSGAVGLAATATDDVGVASVRFTADGTLVTLDTAAPFQCSWDATRASGGPHVLTAIATDAAGNSATATVTVSVNDVTPPLLTAVTATSVTSTGATIAWLSNEDSDSQVEYGATSVYGSTTAVDPSMLTAHAQTITGLQAGTTYHFRVRSRDAAGNVALSADGLFATTASGSVGGVSGPFADMRFDEGSGTYVADASGNGNAGTIFGGAGWIPGMHGQAVVLDGVNDYVQMTHNSRLNSLPLSIGVWFKANTTSYGGIVNKYRADIVDGYQIFLRSGSLCASYVGAGYARVGGLLPCSLSTPIAADQQWHHVAFVVDATGGRLYLDGALESTGAWSGPPAPPANTRDLYLGRRPLWTTSYLSGALDDLLMFDRSLTDAEIASLAGRPPSADVTPPLITGVTAISITSTGATITWTTDESSDSGVAYGPTSGYGSLAGAGSPFMLAHSVLLTGLAPGTTYHYRAQSRDAAGNTSFAQDLTFTTSSTAGPVIEAVVWTNVLNCSTTGGMLSKTGGVDQMADAGATSQQQVISGDGYVEFTANETQALRFAGLGVGNSGTGTSDVDYAIRLQWGIAEVREKGVYRTDTRFLAGDVFRVAVQAGKVKYYKNGVLLYTSGVAPVYPLLLDTSMVDSGSTISNATIARTP